MTAVSERPPEPLDIARAWRLPGPFGELLLARSIDVPREALDARETLGHYDVERWIADRRTRPTMVEIYEGISGFMSRDSLGLAPGAMDATMRAVIQDAIKDGSLLVLRAREPAWISLSRRQPEPLSPPAALAATNETDWFGVFLFDSAGEPIAGEPIAVTLSDTSEVVGSLDGTGSCLLENIAPQAASIATLTFTRLRDARDPLPPNARAARPAELPATVRSPIERIALDRRAGLRKPIRSSLGATIVLQLARREAPVIEVEHFHADGAVVLPGFSPGAAP
jgi:hypothetical protein